MVERKIKKQQIRNKKNSNHRQKKRSPRYGFSYVFIVLHENYILMHIKIKWKHWYQWSFILVAKNNVFWSLHPSRPIGTKVWWNKSLWCDFFWLRTSVFLYIYITSVTDDFQYKVLQVTKAKIKVLIVCPIATY